MHRLRSCLHDPRVGAGRAALLFLAIIAVASPGAVAASQSAVDVQALDAYFANAQREWGVPGMAVAIVKDGEVVLAKGYGVGDMDDGGEVDENTMFAIASNSKAFTSAALAMLVDEGKMSWSDPVTKFLPNFQVYDPVSKILYSGDLGAAPERTYLEVADFDAHAETMIGFHRRYMASSIAMQGWARMVRGLDIDIIAPQHGAWFRGRFMVERFIDWVEQLTVGVDLAADMYKLPQGDGLRPTYSNPDSLHP